MSVTPSPTVVGIFSDRSVVEQAIEALYQAGFSQDQIRYSVPGNSSGGFLNDLKSLFTGANSTDSGDLANDLTSMGLSSEQARYYAHEYDNGNIVMAVHALDREQDALSVFHQFGAYGIHNTLRDATSGVNEDTAYREPAPDAARPSAPYAQQSTDYEHQMAPYAQQPASSTWESEPASQQPLNEDTSPRPAVADEQDATPDYVDHATYTDSNAAYADSNATYADHNADYTEQNSVIVPAGVADQQNLPDNIEPESVVDHQQNLPADEVPVHEPAVSDEHLNAPDQQEQEAQDYQPSAAEATPAEDYQAVDPQRDVTEETTQPIGSGSQTDPYRMPEHTADTEEPVEQVSTPAADDTNRDYPTTVTYDETPQTSTNESTIPMDQPENVVENSADDAASSMTYANEVAAPSTTDYNTEPDLSVDQAAAPVNPVDQTATAATPHSQREEKLLLLQQRLQSAQQRLQDSKTQLQAAKEHETQLQSLKQQLDAIEAELEKNEAELRDTHSRIDQYF